MNSNKAETIIQKEKEHDKPTVFIVGAKPNVIFPEVQPDIVVAANAAIKRVQNYYGKAKIIGIVANSIFLAHLHKIVETIKDCHVDQLIVIDFRNKNKLQMIPEESGIIYNEIIHISRLKKSKIELSSIQFASLLKYVLKNNSIRDVIKIPYHLIVNKKLGIMNTSTGIFGLAFAKSIIDKPANYYIIGIGFETDCHFYDQDNIYIGHFEIDTFYLTSVIKKYDRDKYIITDIKAKEHIMKSLFKNQNKFINK